MLLLSEIVTVNNYKWFTYPITKASLAIPCHSLFKPFSCNPPNAVNKIICENHITIFALCPSATKGMSKSTSQFSTGFVLSSSEIAARKDANKQVCSPYVWSKHNSVGTTGFDLVTTVVSVCQDSFRLFNILLTKQLPSSNAELRMKSWKWWTFQQTLYQIVCQNQERVLSYCF